METEVDRLDSKGVSWPPLSPHVVQTSQCCFGRTYLYPNLSQYAPNRAQTTRSQPNGVFSFQGSNYLGDNVGIKEDIAVTTDSNGQFILELPPGFFKRDFRLKKKKQMPFVAVPGALPVRAVKAA